MLSINYDGNGNFCSGEFVVNLNDTSVTFTTINNLWTSVIDGVGTKMGLTAVNVKHRDKLYLRVATNQGYMPINRCHIIVPTDFSYT